MPDEKPTHAQREDALLLLAEKIGELSDRLEKVETEFSSQTAPLDAASATQQSALASLQAALAGIKALNFHVLDNNLGAVSKRLETVADQATKSIEVLETKVATLNEMRLADAREITHRLKQTEQQRTELAAKRDADAKEFAQVQTAMRRELEQQLGALRDDLRQLAATTPTSFNPRGDWDSQTTYTKLDVVTLNGTSYVSKEADNTDKPGRDSKRWQVLARRGAAAGGGGGSFSEPASLQPLDAGATITWDLINPVASVTLGADANAFTFNNARAGGTYVLILKQDSNGSRTVTWPSNIKWPGNTAPVLTTDADRADVLYLTYDGTVFYGSLAQNFVTS